LAPLHTTGRNNTVQETRYLNTDGFYSASGNYAYSKPFANRKVTVTLNGGASFQQQYQLY
jgi:hypothetical protein